MEQTFQKQLDDIHTLISEMGLAQVKLSSRITRLEKRMLVTQQLVRYLQLEKEGDNDKSTKDIRSD